MKQAVLRQTLQGDYAKIVSSSVASISNHL